MTSKRCAEHPFAGRSTQHAKLKTLPLILFQSKRENCVQGNLSREGNIKENNLFKSVNTDLTKECLNVLKFLKQKKIKKKSVSTDLTEECLNVEKFLTFSRRTTSILVQKTLHGLKFLQQKWSKHCKNFFVQNLNKFSLMHFRNHDFSRGLH